MKNNNNSPKVHFPISGFPIEIQNLIYEGKNSLNCSKSYLVTSVLGVASAALGASSKVKIKEDWTEYPTLFVLIVGDPSSKKSPAFKLVTRPLRIIQENLKNEFLQALKEYNALSKEEKSGVTPPVFMIAFTTDSTTEAMGDALSKNRMGVCIVKDEMSQYFYSMNAYKAGGGDRQILLEWYNSNQIIISRKSSPIPIFLNNPFVSILGGIQPEPLTDVFSKTNDGLIERFCFAYPETNKDHKYSDNEVCKVTLKAYEDLILKIYKQSREKLNKNECYEYRLSKDAKDAWVEWQNNLTRNKKNMAVIEKAIARCVRISLILEVLNNPERELTVISFKSMESAIEISDVFFEHHKKVVSSFDINTLDAKIKKILNWLKKEYNEENVPLAFVKGRQGVPIRRIYTVNVAKLKASNETFNIMYEMESRGYGKIYEDKNKKNHIFSLNPVYYKNK